MTDAVLEIADRQEKAELAALGKEYLFIVTIGSAVTGWTESYLFRDRTIALDSMDWYVAWAGWSLMDKDTSKGNVASVTDLESGDWVSVSETFVRGRPLRGIGGVRTNVLRG